MTFMLLGAGYIIFKPAVLNYLERRRKKQQELAELQKQKIADISDNETKKKILGKLSSESEYFGNHETLDPQNVPPNILALQHSYIFEAIDMNISASSPEVSPGRKDATPDD